MALAKRKQPRRLDLLTVPLLGRFLRWRHARTALQIPLLLLGLLVLDDGFFGPPLAPENFAGVLPWVQWRGFLILGLLVVGNLFCMSCPFMLPRRLAKKLLPAQRTWPRWLRLKWLAIGLLALFFYSYEAFSLWASPLLTAWVVLAYFLAAFVIDGFFQGAAFCKYVCPIGQFNFVNSLVSPFEIKVRQPAMCAQCVTKDCIHGHFENRVPGAPPSPGGRRPLALAFVQGGGRGPGNPGRLVQNGCELWLFQEQKVGNLDCTFCLDCIHACPHDNVGFVARVPVSELWSDPRRSNLGRLGDRPDVAALVVTLVFGAFLNAFAMVTPFYPLEVQLADLLHTASREVVLLLVFGLGLIVLPALLISGAALVSRSVGHCAESAIKIGTRFSYGLVPLGMGMWLAHYGFHFMVGALTVIPVAQSFVADFGLPIFGAPRWGLAELVPLGWTIPIEMACLELGLLGALVSVLRIGESVVAERDRAWQVALPWWLLTLALFAVGWWLMHQPMQMRGTFSAGG
jgi:polyferredoxin